MAWYSNLSKEDRELVEEALAIYATHHYPWIVARLNQLFFLWMRAKGETKDAILKFDKQFWEDTALEKSSSAFGVTVLERGIVLRRQGVVVTITKTGKWGVESTIECDDTA